MSSNYRLAPIFLIRMAGVPFENVGRLSTCETSEVARELLVRRTDLATAKAQAQRSLRSSENAFSSEAASALREGMRRRCTPEQVAGNPPLAFTNYSIAANEVATAELHLKAVLHRELTSCRAALLESSRKVLAPYLVFGGASVRDLLAKLSSVDAAVNVELPTRNTEARKRERHLLLFLQRICAKNDTFSEFGPHGWGTIQEISKALQLAPRTGVAQWESFLERWTAHMAAHAMNADPDIRVELAPRLNPNGRIENHKFIFTETGETIPLGGEEEKILLRCDGETPAYSLGASLELIQDLAAQDILRWEIEIPGLEPYAFELLAKSISTWREGAIRARWLGVLEPIAQSAQAFSCATDPDLRIQIMQEARQRLDQLGVARASAGRFLYAALNPIGEDCFRETGFIIDRAMADQFTTDAEPWIDLWRDSYAFVASRVAAGLRKLLETAPSENGTVPLPAFLRHCEIQKMPLGGHGLVALSVIAFQEVKAAFRKLAEKHANESEWKLTTEDCHFVRREFQYRKFDEYTFPSADLQISAASVEAVGRGEYEWILGEFHPPVALLHHCVFWSCPDPSVLSRAISSTVKGRPNLHSGFFAADFTAHTTIRLFDAMPGLASFVAPERGNSRWHIVPPAEAEVYVEERSGDVCVRHRTTREHLGSFARAWLIPLGFHPFHFSLAGHTPRLRCGNVVVQRRCWTISKEEFGQGKYREISTDLVLEVERLRAQKDWPRFIYIRPSEQALRRSGAEGRDKDTKPVFIDLESYLFLEIFYRWLTKAGELEITEMLPDPEHLLWAEPDGRRTFELRTQIVPR